MTEELVTLETAKLLKEKGFNEYCKNVIDIDNILRETLYRTNENLPKQCFSLPTQSIAQKWLRETKDLHIGICYSHKLFWYYEIMSVSNHVLVGLANRPSIHYNTYEEALEAGIQEALKLI